MDRDYRVIARKNNIVVNKTSGDDLTSFPIEKARFRTIWYSMGASGLCTIGYGWSLHFEAVSSPLRENWIC